MSVVFVATDTYYAPIPSLTPTWLTYLNATTGSSQGAPSITEVGGGSYKFDPSGTDPCGIIDLGGTANPRYLLYYNPGAAPALFVFAAFDEFGAPLAALTPTWNNLKRVSDGTDYTPQPSLTALSGGLYKTTWVSTHVTGMIDLGATAYPRYVHYDSENLSGAVYTAGELFGFSSQREVGPMWIIAPGETDADRKTIYFRIYDSTGLPASGNVGEGAVCSPGAAEKQVNRDLAGFVNAAGTFAHVADGLYKYTFDDTEVSLAGGDGNTIFRTKVTGFRVSSVPVKIRSDADTVITSVTSVSTKLGTPAGASVSADIAAVQTKLGTPTGASVSADIASVSSDVSSVTTDVADVKSDTSLLPAAMPKIDVLYQIEVGRWKVQGTQLLIYDADNTTVLFAFNLKDDTGEASATKVFERVPVP